MLPSHPVNPILLNPIGLNVVQTAPPQPDLNNVLEIAMREIKNDEKTKACQNFETLMPVLDLNYAFCKDEIQFSISEQSSQKKLQKEAECNEMKPQNWTPFVESEHLARAATTTTTTELVNLHESTTKQTMSENKILRLKSSLKDAESEMGLPKGLSRNANERSFKLFNNFTPLISNQTGHKFELQSSVENSQLSASAASYPISETRK